LIDFAIGRDPLSVSNVVDHLILKSAHQCDISSEIEFIASNLNELSIESLHKINSSIFERIVSSEFLRLDNEDSLLNILSSLGYFELLGYVECCFLSVSAIELFLKSISLSSLNSHLWSSICRRLRCKLDLSTIEVNESRFSPQFRFVDDPFSGILSHLTSVCGGNVHSRGVVEITCSSTDSNQCWQVADHGWTGFWASGDKADGWICFDFKEKRVSVRHYTLKSSEGGCYFTDWVIEGSNDGSTWIVLDDRHTDDLIGKSIVKTFACSSDDSSLQFRFIRWKMTDKGKNRPGETRCCHCAKLCNIEFFGHLSRSSA
jgi:hypothetical protein